MPSYIVVQSAGVASSGGTLSQNLSFTSNVAAGNYVIVTLITWATSSGADPVPTDPSNTYTQDSFYASTYGSLSFGIAGIFSAPITVSGPLTVTVTNQKSAYTTFAIYEVQLSGGTTLTAEATGNDLSTSGAMSTADTSALTSLSGNDLVFACWDIRTTAITYTAGTGVTLGYTNNSAGTEGFTSVYALGYTSSSLTPQCLLSLPSQWLGASVAYTISGGGFTLRIIPDSASASESSVLTVQTIDYAPEQELWLTYINSTNYGIGTETQAIYTVVYNAFSADQGFASETQYPLLSPIDVDSGVGLDNQTVISVSSIIDTDFATASDPFILSSLVFQIEHPPIYEINYILTSFQNTDNALANETNSIQLTRFGNQVVDSDAATIGTEASLKFIFQTDFGNPKESSIILSSFYFSDSAIGLENQIIKKYSLEYPTAIELQPLLTTFNSLTDVTTGTDGFILSSTIYQKDSTIALDRQYIFSSFSQTGLTDQAAGYEAWQPRIFAGDFGTESDIQNRSTSPIGGSTGAMELATAIESMIIFKMINDSGRGIENQFINNTIFGSFTGSTDLAMASESQLPIRSGMGDSGLSYDNQWIARLGSDFGTSRDTVLKTTMATDFGTAIDANYLHTHILQPLTVDADSATASESTPLIIRLDSDYGTEFDTQSRAILPRRTTIPNVLMSILQTINNSQIFGPISAQFVIDPDSVQTFPTNPPALCLLEPLDFDDTGNAIGGGRFGKLWDFGITVHVITDNIFDMSYKDTSITTSPDNEIGPYAIAENLINILEQSYPLDFQGNPTLVELPFFVSVGTPRRYKGSNQFSGIPIEFKVKFLQFMEDVIPNNPYSVYAGEEDTDFITFFSAYQKVLIDANLFGPNSVQYAISLDSDFKWPVDPPPFAIIVPSPYRWATEGVGGGRFEKTYFCEFDINIIIDNIFDMAYQDTSLTTSLDQTLGNYEIVDILIQTIEQSWVVDLNGKLVMVELPYATKIGRPRRFKESNEYSFIPVTFRVKIVEYLPANLP